MSGYQVQTPGTFTASSIASPFNPIDNLQNDQIYNLQSFQIGENGNALDREYYGEGGNINLPESATNPNTPYTLTIDQLCNRFLYFLNSTNSSAYSIGGGPSTGAFQTGSIKTYYINILPIGYDLNTFLPLNADLWVEFFQKIKGTYGFNQIPIGCPLVLPSYCISRGTAVVVGYSSANDPDAINGVSYFYSAVNPYDFCGAPLRFNIQSFQNNINASYGWRAGAPTFTGKHFIGSAQLNAWTYAPEDDLWFATFFPEAYNVPAIRCPKADIRSNNQAWPQPL